MDHTLTFSRRRLLAGVRKRLPTYLVAGRPHKDRRRESRAAAKVRIRADGGGGW